ncbi:ATP-dependent DNA/RNA helicase DHX36-like [Lineus longissimus]|uniref:ATP-dependent DNA/RNA helicase DHX36-like n=1 Tax=Lineus longissimus TaxID=88925 RepID=UPI00315D5225
MAQRRHVQETMRRLNLNASPPPPTEDKDDRFRRELEEKQNNEHYQKMQEIRKKLPVYDNAKLICGTIAARKNQVVVISGETGCGKSTQVPQFILDDYIMNGMGSHCRIVCTQPRRISTINLAHRVAEERAERCGGDNSSVGYQIRLEAEKPRENGSILFCTTGIMLKRLESDKYLDRVSHLILDEIHERDINSELLLIIMKEILPHRENMKLILMSATLRAELFSQYYNNCPMLEIPGRIYPVQEYNLEDVVEMISYNHRTEYRPAPRKPERRAFEAWLHSLDPVKYSDTTKRIVDELSSSNDIALHLVKELIRYISQTQGDGAILVFMPGWGPMAELQDMMMKEQLFKSDCFVFHLMHSGLMSTEDLQKAFECPAEGVRKVVIATNVAETSLTIDDIVYVIDCGKVNLKMYEVRRNLSELRTVPNCLANCRQRKGRAGRLRPGVCYYLFTSFEHKRLKEYHEPEILRIRLEELCLQIKLLRPDDKIIPFLDNAMKAPPRSTVEKSIELLFQLNAFEGDEKLTPLGTQLAQMPVNPQISKMIVFAAVFCCLDPILTVAACIDYKSPCYMPKAEDQRLEADKKKRILARGTHSDHLMFINAYNGWCEAKRHGNSKDFCKEFFLSPNILKELKKRRTQFADILVEQGFINSAEDEDANVNMENENLLRAVLCVGLYPNVGLINTQRRVEALGAHYYKVITYGEEVKLAKKSVNCDQPIPEPFIVYFEMMKTSKIFIFDSTGISLNPLIFFGRDLQIKSRTKDENINMAVDNWTQFETTVEKALELQNLRQALWSVLGKKFNNPGPTDWSEMEEEGQVMKKVLRFITEDVSVAVGDEADGAGMY